MDETTRVRDLLERATVPEPPIGPMVQNALRAGARLRRRRRVAGFAAGAAAVAMSCAAALVMTGAPRGQSAAPGNGAATVYVLSGTMTRGTVTPISATTNRPGRPIVLSLGFERGSLIYPITIRPGQPNVLSLGFELGGFPAMAITPNAKTIYAFDGLTAVTPISTATNRAGKPIEVVHEAGKVTLQLVVAPDGKTVYVLDSTVAVTPISTATNRPGRPARLGQSSALPEMAITPDGKTLYVAMSAGWRGPSYVIPVTTATSRPGKRITIATAATAIVAAPDGKTVYLVGRTGQEIQVTPVATATNTPGKPINVGKDSAIATPAPVALTPDGQTIYIPDTAPNGVIPFSTATNRPGKMISFGGATVYGIAIAPDGRTAYVLSQPPGQQEQTALSGSGAGCLGPPGAVTPIATATNTAGKPIKVGCEPRSIAFTPDGKTIYVSARSDTVTPITTATGRPGKPINVEQPFTITIAP